MDSDTFRNPQPGSRPTSDDQAPFLERGPEFDPLQPRLALEPGSFGWDGRVEVRRTTKVLQDYLESIGVSEPGRVARMLLERFGSLSDILAASEWSLRRTVGERLARAIRSSHALMTSMLRETVEQGPIVPRSRELIDLLQAHIGFLRNERLLALYVDSNTRLLAITDIAEGGPACTASNARRIIESGLAVGASGFFLVHNHPSGMPKPSNDDLLATAHLRELASALDLHLIDHLIIARGRFCTIDECWREAQWDEQARDRQRR